MDINSKKSGLETYLSILNMDKTECQLTLKTTKEKLVKTNNDILETKKLINLLDEKIRELSLASDNFTIESYDLIRKNIFTLIENETELKNAERELSADYDAQLKELQKKLNHMDVCAEKHSEYNAILQHEQDKRISSELDDLCGQRKWILTKDG